jgi:hypothetical protein
LPSVIYRRSIDGFSVALDGTDNAGGSPPHFGGFVHRLLTPIIFIFALLLLPDRGLAQQNVPPAAQRAEAEVETAARRFGLGVQGGIGLDPELILFGAHGTFGPLFNSSIQFRPGVEFGLGELTTAFGINLDVLYTIPGSTADTRWRPYVGAGPNFSLSHRGFSTEEGDHVDIDDEEVEDDEPNRFDFSDTDFSGGMNFIIGMRRANGMFFEMNATAWGVSNVRLLLGVNF